MQPYRCALGWERSPFVRCTHVPWWAACCVPLVGWTIAGGAPCLTWFAALRFARPDPPSPRFRSSAFCHQRTPSDPVVGEKCAFEHAAFAERPHYLLYKNTMVKLRKELYEDGCAWVDLPPDLPLWLRDCQKALQRRCSHRFCQIKAF